MINRQWVFRVKGKLPLPECKDDYGFDVEFYSSFHLDFGRLCTEGDRGPRFLSNEYASPDLKDVLAYRITTTGEELTAEFERLNATSSGNETDT